MRVHWRLKGLRDLFCRTSAMIMIVVLTIVLGGYSAAADNWHRGGHARRGHENFEHRDYRGHARPWHFKSRRGWRYERGPHLWSPFFVWWLIGDQVLLRPAPSVTIVNYPTGYYELRGNGITAPYYWIWIPAAQAPPPPPLPPSYSAAPPPPPAGQYIPGPAPPSGNKTTSGTIIGGALGAAVGSTVRGHGRTAGIIVGTLLGAIIGHDIGQSLDEADELRAAHVLEKNKTGQASTWVNPDGAKLTVVPERTFKNSSGQYCREYQLNVLISGEAKKAFGTACRQPDGQWKIVH